jgi:hypothetical protein
MQNSFELKALKSDSNDYQGNIECYKDKFARVQIEFMNRVEK